MELSSGAVRNHDPEIMVKAFELVGLGEEDVKAKFPAMYNAFCYGAPPHAGIAPGVDRMVMLLCGESSIREVIAFPMNKSAQDLMMDAPAPVTPAQLEELSIQVVNIRKKSEQSRIKPCEISLRRRCETLFGGCIFWVFLRGNFKNPQYIVFCLLTAPLLWTIIKSVLSRRTGGGYAPSGRRNENLRKRKTPC